MLTLLSLIYVASFKEKVNGEKNYVNVFMSLRRDIPKSINDSEREDFYFITALWNLAKQFSNLFSLFRQAFSLK